MKKKTEPESLPLFHAASEPSAKLPQPEEAYPQASHGQEIGDPAASIELFCNNAKTLTSHCVQHKRPDTTHRTMETASRTDESKEVKSLSLDFLLDCKSSLRHQTDLFRNKRSRKNTPPVTLIPLTSCSLSCD